MDLPFEPLFDGKAAGEIAQRKLVVKFKEQVRTWLREKILAGNFSGVDGCKGHCRDEARCDHEFRGAANVPLTNEEIEVAVAAHRGVAVGPDREDRTFDNQCADSRRSKLI